MSESAVEQSRVIGQKASIRCFNPNDDEDVRRLYGILQDSRVQKWVDSIDDMDIQDVIKWSSEKGKEEGDDRLYAVSGSPVYVQKDEIGEVQGFINTYPAKDLLVRRLVEKGMVRNDPLIIEVSYARNSMARSGQIADALIQVCFELNKMSSSDKDELSPSLQIVAFVEKDNLRSIKVLENAGFAQIGKIPYREGNKREDLVYKVDWQKAQAILHTEADKSFIHPEAR